MQSPGMPKTNNPLAPPDNNRHAPAVILIDVKGTPRPQPRPRFVRGRTVSTADANAKRWIASVEAATRAALAEHGQQTGPLSVLLSFHFPTPKKDRHGLPHTHVPDADNLAKLVLDSLMRAGLFKDDSAISCLVARKTWAASPSAGVSITIGPDRRVSLPQPTGPAWLAD